MSNYDLYKLRMGTSDIAATTPLKVIIITNY